MKRISVVIAALNEERYIGEVLRKIKGVLNGRDYEIVVVDNGSSDNTPKIAGDEGAIVIKEKKQGKGWAVIKGISKANGDIVVFIDGDASYPADAIQSLISPIESGRYDVVFGSRFLKYKPEMNFIRLLGNRIFSLLASLLFGKTTDLLTGMTAIRRDILSKLTLESKGFELETEFFIKCNKLGLRRVEIPIKYKGRRDSKLNPIFDGVKILKHMLRSRLW